MLANYGPNAEILGNIGNDYWHLEKVLNVYDKLSTTALFLGWDLISGIIFGLVLWVCCGLNTYRTCGYIIHHYGLLLMFYIGGFLTMVCKL